MHKSGEGVAIRQRRISLLASADPGLLDLLFRKTGLPEDHVSVRGPETGLVTVRGRTGGGGAPFNVGEATVTRATVRLPDGAVGHSIMLGTDRHKARLAAILDALATRPGLQELIEERILAPLERAQADGDDRVREETAATRVDFFTMVRGED